MLLALAAPAAHAAEDVQPTVDAAALRAEADALYDEVKLDDAAGIYAVLVAARPEDPALRIRYADCLTRTDRFQEAIEHASEAVKLSGRSSASLATLGLARHREGSFDVAEERLREGAEADEDCARCWWGLARVEAIRGAYTDAANHYQRTASLEPENPLYLRSLAPFVTERVVQIDLYRRYLELPRREEMRVWENGRAWLAMLEYAGDRPLSQVDIPEGGAEVRLEPRGGMHYLSVDVGSRRKRRYLFDTGASGFTISPGLMRRLKLQPVDVFTITGIGGEGTAKTQMVLVDEVRVGEVVVRNVPAVVAESAPLVDGLLGPTFFGGATVALDPRRLRLRIGDQPAEAPEEENKEKRKKEKRRKPLPEAVEIPFLSINGIPFIPVTLDGVTMNAMIDTGGSQAMISSYAADQVPSLELLSPALAPPAYREIRGVTGSARQVRVVRGARLEFAGRTLEMAAHVPDPDRILISQDLTPFSHALGTEVWAILGNPQLDDFHLTIDWGRQVVRMAPVR